MAEGRRAKRICSRIFHTLEKSMKKFLTIGIYLDIISTVEQTETLRTLRKGEKTMARGTRYTEYFESNGKYFQRDMVWWSEGGYYRPMRAVKISRRQYRKAMEVK